MINKHIFLTLIVAVSLIAKETNIFFIIHGNEIDDYKDFFHLLDKNYDHTVITITKFLEFQKHSYIFFIKDAEGNEYIVKQDKSVSLKHQFQVVLEKLSAYMASAVGISAHKVEIIAAHIPFPGKIIQERPASIHTFMPGISIRDLPEGALYQGISIKQAGNPKRPRLGLNTKVIRRMAEHDDLPPIVALDTFISNSDRNKANVLYDEINNRFYAIDMCAIYDIFREDRIPIAILACNNISAMIQNKIIFPDKQICALKKYQSVLLELLEKFPPTKIYSLMYHFIEQAGLGKECNFRSLNAMFQYYKNAIEETYKECERLVILISELLEINTKAEIEKELGMVK